MINNKTKKIILISLFIIILILLMQIFPLVKNSIAKKSEKSDSHNNVETFCNYNLSDYVQGNTRSNSDYNLKTKLIEDDFINESMISNKKNIFIDSVAGEVKLKIDHKTIGGNQWDNAFEGQQTVDGGYIITGITRSYGGEDVDIWLVKTDNLGNLEWHRTFGGSKEDHSRSVQQTSDGGYIITGWTYSYAAIYIDIWLIKTDNNGNLEWSKTFGGERFEHGNSVIQTNDGGYVIVGSTDSYGAGGSDIWLVKTNSQGVKEWNKTFGTNLSESGNSIQQTSDGGYIITGYIQFLGTSRTDLWLIKTNNYGDEIWNKTFGGNLGDKGLSVKETSDGGYIIVGNTMSFGSGRSDIWLIKTDSNGNEEWNKTFGGDGWEASNDVEETSDGGYIIIGWRGPYCVGKFDIWIIKTNNIGNMEWNKTYGGQNDNWGRSIIQNSNNGYTIIATTEYFGAGSADFWVIQIDNFGNNKTYGELISTNLIKEENTISFNLFNYTVIIPTGTEIKIQFSQDCHNWYNSSGLLNEYDKLESKNYSFEIIDDLYMIKKRINYINLSSLGWSEPYFYYKMNFSSDTMGIPSVQNINISYTINLGNKFESQNNNSDSDGDNIINSEDIDDDNDKYHDDWENFLGTDHQNSSSKPLDTDLDNIPDGDSNNSQPWMDTDDDNDNFTDLEELSADTDPLDDKNYPIDDDDYPLEKDEDEVKVSNNIDCSIYVILIGIIIVILVLLIFYINLKRKKGK